MGICSSCVIKGKKMDETELKVRQKKKEFEAELKARDEKRQLEKEVKTRQNKLRKLEDEIKARQKPKLTKYKEIERLEKLGEALRKKKRLEAEIKTCQMKLGKLEKEIKARWEKTQFEMVKNSLASISKQNSFLADQLGVIDLLFFFTIFWFFFKFKIFGVIQKYRM